MYNFRVIWINGKGAMFDRESNVTHDSYDLAWKSCVEFLKAHKITTGKALILKDGKMFDEIIINS